MQNEASEADRLMRIVERMVRVFRAHAASEPLSATAGSTLNTLEGEGAQGITQLARAQGVTQPAMTQTIDRLESAGLVARRTQRDDRRAVLVELTAAGAAAVAERRARRAARFDQDLDALTDRQRASLVAALPALESLAAAMAESLAGTASAAAAARAIAPAITPETTPEKKDEKANT